MGLSFKVPAAQKNFEASVPMVQLDELISYNPFYLSVAFKLQAPWEEPDGFKLVNYNGQMSEKRWSTEENRSEGWLLPYIEYFSHFEKRPWFFVNGDTDLLARMFFTGEDQMWLKNREVAVFFYEPLVQRSTKNPHFPALYSMNSEDIYFPELNWLEDFKKHHNGKIEITAYVCDYRLPEYLERHHLYPGIKVKVWDLFLAHLAAGYMLGHQEAVYRKQVLPQFNAEINKKFVCPNFRYDGTRELIASFLQSQHWADEGYISFFFRHQKELLRQTVSFSPVDLKQWKEIESGMFSMQKRLPLVMDTQSSQALDPSRFLLPDQEAGVNLRQREGLDFFYKDSFLSIVNETRFCSPCGEVSEKTLRPIFCFRPFVIAGSPFVLRYLREMGFETFGDIWDESYDEIEDHGRRLEALLETIRSIVERPLEELQRLLESLQGRLERNHHHLIHHICENMHFHIFQESEV